MRWADGKADYGWISIGLHWVSAALIVALLFVGDSIRTAAGVQTSALRFHTTLALSGYAVLWLRVWWRIRSGHPAAPPGQKRLDHLIGAAFHYLLVAALAGMLLSGPLMAWGGGIALYLGAWRLPSPPIENALLFAAGRRVHLAGAATLAIGALVHIAAVIKHTFIDHDGGLDRIMVPASKPPAGSSDV